MPFFPRRSLPLAVLTSGALLLVALAACNSGTVSTPPTNTLPSAMPVASATPLVLPSSAPFSVSTSQPLPQPTAPPAGQTPGPVPVAVPTTSSGFSASVQLPISSTSSIPAGTTVVSTLTNQAPSTLPALQAALSRRGASSEAASVRTMATGSNISIILFMELAFSGGVTLANEPALSFQLPSGYVVGGASYYVALFDPTNPGAGWQTGFEGPGTVSGSTVSFGGAGNTFSFAAFYPYWFALYAQTAAAPTPSPAPTQSPTPVPTASPTPGVTPTPVPTPQFGVSPSSVSLTAVGQTAQIAATGTAPYNVFSSNTAVATIAPSSGSSPFTVTAVAAGTATITIADATGKVAYVTVTVTTTIIPVQ